MPASSCPPTPLNDGHCLARVEAQARYLGAMVGREAAEAFRVSTLPLFADLVSWPPART